MKFLIIFGLLLAVPIFVRSDNEALKVDPNIENIGKQNNETVLVEKNHKKRGLYESFDDTDFDNFGSSEWNDELKTYGETFDHNDFSLKNFKNDFGNFGNSFQTSIWKKSPLNKIFPTSGKKIVPFPVKIPVPKPYTIIKHVPYTIKKLIKVPVHVPEPVILEKKIPIPVRVPVEKPVPVKVYISEPFPVEKRIPVPIRVPVPHPFPVEKPVPFPVRVPVPIIKPIPVIKKVPYQVRVPIDRPVPVQVPVQLTEENSQPIPFDFPLKSLFNIDQQDDHYNYGQHEPPFINNQPNLFDLQHQIPKLADIPVPIDENAQANDLFDKILDHLTGVLQYELDHK